MRPKRFLVFSLMLMAAFPTTTSAATITVFDQSTGEPIIMLNGTIKSGDEERFRSIAAKYRNAIVNLNSDGGEIVPAMEIGRIIRLREYVTAVYKTDVCASACALVWIAGQKRVIFNGGRVGFHASYTDEDGKLIETGVGNALVGHYLSQLGFGEKTVIFATEAAPDKILWLDPSSTQDSGIEFSEIPAPSEREQGSALSRPSSNMTIASPPEIRLVPPAVPKSDEEVASNFGGSPALGDAKHTLRNVDNFARGLRLKGYKAEVDYSDPSSPSIITGVNGHHVLISFSSCSQHDCNYIELISYWTGVSYNSFAVSSQKWGTKEHFSSLLFDPKNGSVAAYHYIIAGSDGITLQNLVENLEYFSNDFGDLGKLLLEGQ